MYRFLLIVMVACPAIALCDVLTWQPPEDPNLRVILNEAQEDREAGRYQQSLEKHVWYHENALKIDSAYHGVRLSFALSDWRQLANRYEPALEKMREIRDRAERWVKQNKDDSDAFQDVVALNIELKDTDRTVHLFRWLHENDPDFAESMFPVARDTLIAAGEVDLCGEYVGDVDTFRSDLRDFRRTEELMLRLGDSEEVEEGIQYYRRFFVYGLSNDIATLVRIGRYDEAMAIGTLALEEFGDKLFRSSIEKAMNGGFANLAEFYPLPSK